MWPETLRTISQQEAAVVASALRNAPTGIAAFDIEMQVPSLTVTNYCPCGCGSVSFAGPPIEGLAKQLADGRAFTAGGTQVGVFVWGTPERISSLEIYQMDEDDASLPDPATVERWPPKEVPGDV